jgi:hypothetical protein
MTTVAVTHHQMFIDGKGVDFDVLLSEPAE